MQGVEILTSTRVVVDWDFNWTDFWIIMGIILLGFIIKGIIEYRRTGDITEIIGFSAIGIGIGVLAGIFVSSLCSTPTDYETQYKVTISEEVSMTEFLEHYEVLEQDGKLFTVKEKVNE